MKSLNNMQQNSRKPSGPQLLGGTKGVRILFYSKPLLNADLCKKEIVNLGIFCTFPDYSKLSQQSKSCPLGSVQLHNKANEALGYDCMHTAQPLYGFRLAAAIASRVQDILGLKTY